MASHLVWISAFAVLAVANGMDFTNFCQQQGTLFNQASRNIGKAALNGGDLCGNMEKFLETAYDTNATCYDKNDDMKSRDIQAAWRHVSNVVVNTCPDSELPSGCSDDVTSRLMTQCTQIVNSVQMGATADRMCQFSREFIQCLEQMIGMCSGSRSLVRANVHAAIASTRSSMHAHCPENFVDQMQADVPGGGSPVGPATASRCQLSTINAEVTECTREFQTADRDSLSSSCRALHRLLGCVDRIRINCPSVPYTGYETLLDSYQSTCGNAFITCPREVEIGSQTAQGYCLARIPRVSENSSLYCSKMTELSNCLTALRDVCPVARDSDREGLDRLSSGIDEGLGRYC